MPFEPCGIITLTTDFGLVDPFVGIMKGRILGRFPTARIVDLTHGIGPQAVEEAGFWLERSIGYFPAGTVHVAVVDPGVGTARAVLAAPIDGQLLLAPDNGLLAPLAARHTPEGIVRVELPRLERFGIRALSATFHGRDLFAPLAAELARGSCSPEELGDAAGVIVRAPLPVPRRSSEGIEGHVITVDHFGNLITDIEASELASLAHPHVELAELRLPLSRTYADVSPGEYLALVNSFGRLEIARAQSSAAAGLALGRGAAVRVRPAGEPIAGRRA